MMSTAHHNILRTGLSLALIICIIFSIFPCQVQAACSHRDTYQETYTIYNDDGVLEGDSQKHNVTTYRWTYCRDCGASVNDEKLADYDEPHSFSSNGRCTKCDYYKYGNCSHSKTKTTFQIFYNDDGVGLGDPNGHWRVRYQVIQCANCDEILGGGDEVYDDKYEPHSYNSQGICACGYSKKPVAPPQVTVAPPQITASPAPTAAPLKVSLSAWEKKVTLGARIGADAKITGGSGSFSCYWNASNEQGQSVQASTGSNDSWGFAASTAGKWQITVTVEDRVTGKSVSATVKNIVVASNNQYIIETSGRDARDYSALQQTSSTFKNLTYGSSTVGNAACGLFAFLNLAVYDQGSDFSADDVERIIKDMGGKTTNADGLKTALLSTEIHFSVDTQKSNIKTAAARETEVKAMRDWLKTDGNYVIVSTQNFEYRNTKNSGFHFVAVIGVNEDGDFIIMDSAGEYNQTYYYEQLLDSDGNETGIGILSADRIINKWDVMAANYVRRSK